MEMPIVLREKNQPTWAHINFACSLQLLWDWNTSTPCSFEREKCETPTFIKRIFSETSEMHCGLVPVPPSARTNETNFCWGPRPGIAHCLYVNMHSLIWLSGNSTFPALCLLASTARNHGINFST